MNCDWCGKEFNAGETPMAGFADLLTHKGCVVAARRAYRKERGISYEFENSEPRDREPFDDWPNGQGCYE